MQFGHAWIFEFLSCRINNDNTNSNFFALRLHDPPKGLCFRLFMFRTSLSHDIHFWCALGSFKRRSHVHSSCGKKEKKLASRGTFDFFFFFFLFFYSSFLFFVFLIVRDNGSNNGPPQKYPSQATAVGYDYHLLFVIFMT